jgi:hypothetical protein
MSIKEKYNVFPIESYLCKDWLLHKHYAKRIPSISYSFGLYNNDILQGVITFGMPPSSTLSESICGAKYKKYVIELNRLVVNDNLEKNVLSYFVSNSIKMLPKPSIIISFSDLNMNHNGYIYQACNFLYTGQSSNNHKLIDINGEEFHFRNIGHYQKNNKLKVNLLKRRKNENLINKLDIVNYLKEYKGNYKLKELDKIFGYKDTCSHWFRTDSGFSFPSIEDWIKLKDILKFDEKYDDIMLDYELVPDSNEIKNKLKLTKIDILPKNRYLFIHTSNNDRKDILKNLKLNILPYPKGENKKYDSSFKPIIQKILF